MELKQPVKVKDFYSIGICFPYIVSVILHSVKAILPYSLVDANVE